MSEKQNDEASWDWCGWEFDLPDDRFSLFIAPVANRKRVCLYMTKAVGDDTEVIPFAYFIDEQRARIFSKLLERIIDAEDDECES